MLATLRAVKVTVPPMHSHRLTRDQHMLRRPHQAAVDHTHYTIDCFYVSASSVDTTTACVVCYYEQWAFRSSATGIYNNNGGALEGPMTSPNTAFGSSGFGLS
eukprot:m.77437 g.77437  ORF g.77437 m.77437 type:complete len:103 (-) comp16201_c0_seq2:625-933(-)